MYFSQTSFDEKHSFFQVDGLRIIEQLLCSRGSLIEDRIEAAGVLAQITSPWISDNHKINHLDNFVYNMVNALTGMFPLYNSPQGNKHFRGNSKTTLTNFPLILTTYLPPVDIFT